MRKYNEKMLGTKLFEMRNNDSLIQREIDFYPKAIHKLAYREYT